MFEWLAAIPPVLVLGVVFGVVLLESMGLPLPGETILIAAILIATGSDLSPWAVGAAAAAGAAVGDSIGYLIGRRWGSQLLTFLIARFPRHFSVRRVNTAIGIMQRRGPLAVFFGRFVAILRILAGPLAGTLRMPYRRFLFANVTGAIVWAAAITAVVSALGRPAIELIHRSAWWGLGLAGVIILVVAIVIGYRARRRALAGEQPGADGDGDEVLDLPAAPGALAGGQPPADGETPGGSLWRSAAAAFAAIGAVLRRSPVTFAALAVYFVVGAVTGALVRPLHHDVVAAIGFGLPAFEDGRWWTLVTGSTVSNLPWLYGVLGAVFVIVGVVVERRLGSRIMLLTVVGAQLLAVLGAAGLLAALSPLPWEWSTHLATLYDVGPSGGVMGVLTLAIVSWRSPWRFRFALVLGAVVILRLMYIGTLSDLEHSLAVAGVAGVWWLRRGARTPSRGLSIRETRILVSTALVAIVAVQVLVELSALSGPFGSSDPTPGGWGNVLVDVIVVSVVVQGIRRGHRLAWWGAVALGALNLLQLAILIVIFVVLGGIPGELASSLVSSVLWLGLFVALIVWRRAFRVPTRRRLRELVPRTRGHAVAPPVDVRALLKRVGGGNLSWMATWPGNSYFPVSGGQGAVAYQRHAGVAIALGDPIVEEAGRGAALAEYAQRCEQAGLTPALFSVGRASVEAAPAGWRSVRVADDSIIDLGELHYTGKAWNQQRTALNRATREGIEFRLVRLADEPWAIQAQVRAISEAWLGEKDLPEMSFTLGGVDEALDPETWVGIAVDGDGSVHGITSWLPVYAAGGVVRGWTLDLMRRRDGGFVSVMEFLISSALLAFQEKGAEFVSLSGAPLAGGGDEPAQALDAVLNALGEMLEPLYGFRSLHNFKNKFHPRYEPLYLLYRDEGDLPRVATGLARAFLPNTSGVKLAALGLSAGRDGARAAR